MNEDLSDLFSKLKLNKDSISPEMVDNLINMLHNSNTTTSSDTESDNEEGSRNDNNIDFETILKMKSIMEKMNDKDDPRRNLLLSLKPYLKDSRKEKLDQYLQLLNVSRVLDVFPFLGGENKNASK